MDEYFLRYEERTQEPIAFGFWQDESTYLLPLGRYRIGFERERLNVLYGDPKKIRRTRYVVEKVR